MMQSTDSSQVVLTPATRTFLQQAQQFEDSCAEINTKGAKSKIRPEALVKRYGLLTAAFENAQKSLVGRVDELAGIEEIHQRAQEQFFRFFSPTKEVIETPKSGMKGIVNGGKNNCAFNALLQVIFHAPSLRDALLSVPEYGELRKACKQYFGLAPGKPDSQKIREMMSDLFGRALVHRNYTYQDATELLGLLVSRVPAPVAQRLFPSYQEVRQWEPTGATKALTGNPAERSALDENGCTTGRMICEPDIRIGVRGARDPRDPLGVERLPEANFEEMRDNAFHAQAEMGGNVGENGWLLGEDLGLLYEHRQVALMRKYTAMPQSLVVSLNRFRRDQWGHDRAVDTAMQMGRVFEIPAESVPDDTEDRRLVLRSFVIFHPGHYTSYVRMGDQWYHIDDSRPTPVTIEDVDQALYQYPGGGSYIHFYEQGDADAEPPMTVHVHREVENANAHQKLVELQKLFGADIVDNVAILKCFDELPKKTKNLFYGQIYELEGKKRKEDRLGEKLLRQDPTLLMKHKLLEAQISAVALKKKPVRMSQLEIALELSDALSKNRGKPEEWLALFGRLDKKYQSIATKMLWENSDDPHKNVPGFGRATIQKNPLCLLDGPKPVDEPVVTDPLATGIDVSSVSKSVKVQMRYIDHIVNTIMDDESSTALLAKLSSYSKPKAPYTAPSYSSSNFSLLNPYSSGGSFSWISAFLGNTDGKDGKGPFYL